MKRCMLCSGNDLYFPNRSEVVKGVTSDCKPWTEDFSLFMCGTCGHVQKERSETWSKEVVKIYANYTLYPLCTDSDQLKFDDSGNASFRSTIVVDNFLERFSIPEKGKILDIGCGNGCFLDQFYKRKPEWELCGYEQGARLEGVSPFLKNKVLYTGDLSGIEGKFDVIVLLQVLEHVVEPISFLKTIRDMLTPEGYLLVLVPNYLESPFDLMVYDHCSHYSYETLKFVAQTCGMSLSGLTTDWIPKEIGFIAQKETKRIVADPAVDLEPFKSSVACLYRFLNKARDIDSKCELGVFGTAIAGTWLAHNLGETVSFFVEEDRRQIGKKHIDVPVLAPEDVPIGATVIMGFMASIASKLVDRLKEKRPDVNYIIPDD